MSRLTKVFSFIVFFIISINMIFPLVTRAEEIEVIELPEEYSNVESKQENKSNTKEKSNTKATKKSASKGKKSKLPYTGENMTIPVFIGTLIIVSIVLWKKNIKYKKI